MANVNTTPAIGIFSAWVPAYTGFSADPTSVTARATQLPGGKLATGYLSATAGTSNTTAKTVTLAFTAANTAIQTHICQITNNGTIAVGMIVTRVNSNIADCYATIGGGAWTGSGTCNIRMCGMQFETT